jgi:hypothetical protein
MTDRLLTVKDAMEIIPLGKTKVTAIINSIPHINTGGKLLFRQEFKPGRPQYIRYSLPPKRKKAPPAAPPAA